MAEVYGMVRQSTAAGLPFCSMLNVSMAGTGCHGCAWACCFAYFLELGWQACRPDSGVLGLPVTLQSLGPVEDGAVFGLASLLPGGLLD